MMVLVSNDLTHDQRVSKTCQTLRQEGWEVFLLGRKTKASSAGPSQWPHHRFWLPFNAGIGFYASLQIALFWKLLWSRYDAIWANDLDTILPAYFMKILRNKPIIYDSHEFFTEAAGLTGRPVQRGVWLTIERFVFPRLKAIITVNDGIADAYQKRYPKGRAGRPLVVRNMPRLKQRPGSSTDVLKKHGIHQNGPLLILQGAFMDKDRGVLQALEAMKISLNWTLLLVGAGEEFEMARRQVDSFKGRLICLDKLPFEELCALTASADVGLSLDVGLHGNYWMSLPNKLFDYIHAEIPVVVSPMPEVKKIVVDWEVGAVIADHAPESIAAAIEHVLAQPKSEWKVRCQKAKNALHWEAEEGQIREALTSIGCQSQDL